MRLTPRGCAAVLLAVLAVTGAQAQTSGQDLEAARRQAEQIQRQEQDRLEREQDVLRRPNVPATGMDTRTLVPATPLPKGDGSCSQIDDIVVKGSQLFPSYEKDRVFSPYLHRCLGVSDLEQLLGAVTQFYINAGYITTRVYLAPQQIANGRLELMVVEGRVVSLSVDGPGSANLSLDTLFPGVVGRILNLRDLEQGIDQINRLTSNNARLDIQPGEQPGQSEVIIHNTSGSPLHLGINQDNQGSKSTGQLQTGLSATADRLLGLNEQLSLTHRESTPGDKARQFSSSDSLNFSVPFGYTTLSGGTSVSTYASAISVPSGLVLISSGDTETNNLRLDRVMYRDQANRATLAATFTTKDAKNYLDGQYLTVSSRKLAILDIDASLNTRFLGGVLTLDLGAAQGLDTAGALQDPAGLPDNLPRAQFAKVKAGFHFNRPFNLNGNEWSVSSQMVSQFAQNTLYGSEQISIGGVSSVRGFVNNTLSGDDGYYLRNELSVRVPLQFGEERVFTRVYFGYDVGEVSNRAAGILNGQLVGQALGISTNWRGASWDWFYTWPVTMPGNFVKEAGQTWFRVAYSF